MLHGGGWSRKGDLTTLGTLKRSLTSRIKLKDCNCRRRRHCDSTFPSLSSSDSSFRYLPSLTHSSRSYLPSSPSALRVRFDTDLVPLSPTREYNFPSLTPRAVTAMTMIKLFLMWEHAYRDDVSSCQIYGERCVEYYG